MASFLKGNQTATTCCHFQKLAAPFFVWLVHTEAIKKLSKSCRNKTFSSGTGMVGSTVRLLYLFLFFFVSDDDYKQGPQIYSKLLW